VSAEVPISDVLEGMLISPLPEPAAGSCSGIRRRLAPGRLLASSAKVGRESWGSRGRMDRARRRGSGESAEVREYVAI
jgi:hypothetical protein